MTEILVTYMVEPWSKVWPELFRMWSAHWEEVARDKEKIRLDVDFEAYASLEAQGQLHVVVARCDGFAIGYHISFVRPHFHYRASLSAFTDVYYIEPAYRKGGIGINLFREVEKTLKARGVEKMFSGTKKSLDMSRLFEHLGWSEAETLFCKYIGD